jgi:hypothetical protein
MPARDTCIHYDSPKIKVVRPGNNLYVAAFNVEDAPPCCNTAEGPGRCVHVFEMCRCWDDLVTLDDNM